MMDRFGRRVTYLRVSLTNRCQLACTYCTLQDEPTTVLQPEEVERLIEVCARRLGFRKVRLTGGEPTLRRDLPDIVERLARIEGLREVALTTNGMLMERRAEALAKAGLRTVNISCDTLDPDKFSKLTGGGNLDEVLRGLRAAREAGIERRKINAVLQEELTDEEVEAFVELSAQEDAEVRFIEHMPMDSERIGSSRIDPREVLNRLGERHGLDPLPTRADGGPAERFAIGKARIGFIHAMSNPFCDRCNRLRVTAEGKIRSCLLTGGEVDLLSVLRSGSSETVIEEGLVEAMSRAADAKPPIYDLQREGSIPMRAIGG